MTHYDTLGVSENATPEEITAAYRKIQKEYHPDVYKGDNVEFAQEKVKEANAAYDVLHDPTKKADYDRMLKYGAPYGAQGNPYGPQGSPFGQYGPFYTYNGTGQTQQGNTRYYYYNSANQAQNPGQRRVKRLGSLGTFVVRLATFYLILRLFGLIGFRLPFFFFFF